MAELALLAESAGSIPKASVVGRRGSVDPALFIRSGKANELLRTMKEHDAELAIVNHAISPTQQRNLERHLGRHVIDRLQCFNHRELLDRLKYFATATQTCRINQDIGLAIAFKGHFNRIAGRSG